LSIYALNLTYTGICWRAGVQKSGRTGQTFRGDLLAFEVCGVAGRPHVEEEGGSGDDFWIFPGAEKPKKSKQVRSFQ